MEFMFQTVCTLDHFFALAYEGRSPKDTTICSKYLDINSKKRLQIDSRIHYFLYNGYLLFVVIWCSHTRKHTTMPSTTYVLHSKIRIEKNNAFVKTRQFYNCTARNITLCEQAYCPGVADSIYYMLIACIKYCVCGKKLFRSIDMQGYTLAQLVWIDIAISFIKSRQMMLCCYQLQVPFTLHTNNEKLIALCPSLPLVAASKNIQYKISRLI